MQTYGTAWKLEMDNCESLNVYSLAGPWTMRSCHPVGYHWDQSGHIGQYGRHQDQQVRAVDPIGGIATIKRYDYSSGTRFQCLSRVAAALSLSGHCPEVLWSGCKGWCQRT